MNLGRILRLGAIVVVGIATLASSIAVITPKVGEIVAAHRFEMPPLSLDPLSERSYVYDRYGNLMGTFVAVENRVQVDIADVPRTVIDAVLAAEDSTFFSHRGVNVQSIARAFTANVESGGVSQGGSTITQQVVKNAITGAEQDFSRKIEEAVLAIELEETYTKDEILERYLNTIYLGAGAYGVQAAAEVYFNKDVGSLDWAEAALLAGLIRCPSTCDPFRSTAAARVRRNTVIDSLYTTGRIDELERDVAKFTQLPEEPHLPERPNDYFIQAVEEMLLEDERLGETPTARYNRLFGGGLRIHTTFDPGMYLLAQVARNETLPNHNGDGTFQLADNPVTGARRIGTAAMVSVEPATGAVRYLLGGPGFDRYQYDLARSSNRQVGSTFKTFVLAQALLEGHSPLDTISGTSPCGDVPGYPEDDPPQNFGGGSGSSGGTLTSQTLSSSNCAFLRLNQIVGPDEVADLAQRMGVSTDLHPEYASMALGSDGISPLDMAVAYATLADDGVRNDPYLIDRVEEADGGIVLTHEAAPERVLPVNVARLVTDVLRQNVESGTGTRARLSRQPAAGKTGTTNGPSDVWFVGYTPQLSTAVWIGGTSDNRPLQGVGTSVTGGALPARTWGRFTEAALDGEPVVEFEEPEPVPGGDRFCLPATQRRCPRGTIGPDGVVGRSGSGGEDGADDDDN